MPDPTAPRPETMNPEDVPAELIDLAMTGAKPGCRGDAAFYLANVLPEIKQQVHAQVAAETRRETAERILLASDVALGYRCPACYGKPAVHRWKNTGRKRRYVCGCGHEWDALSRSAEWRAALDASPTALLRKVAKTGDLPEVPEKIARGES